MNQQQESTRSNLSAEQLAQATAYGLAERLGDTLRRQGLILGTAESCTGGLLAGAVTAVPGSSEWFDRGFITYSNDAKVAELDVSPDALHHFGAVSEPVALEMANGVLLASPAAQVAVSTTGIAGPGWRHAGQAGGHGVLWLRAAGRRRHQQPRRHPRVQRRPRAGAQRLGRIRVAWLA